MELCLGAFYVGTLIFGKTFLSGLWPILSRSLSPGAAPGTSAMFAPMCRFWLQVTSVPILPRVPVVLVLALSNGFILISVVTTITTGYPETKGTTISEAREGRGGRAVALWGHAGRWSDHTCDHHCRLRKHADVYSAVDTEQ